MNGDNSEDNLVNLTAREHFIAHLLLVKLYPKHMGLVKAAMMICVIGEGQSSRINNRQYNWLKIKHSIAMSLAQSGKNNSNYGKMYIYNLELKKCIKIFKTEIIPPGWIKGRRLNFDTKIIKCKECQKEFDKRLRNSDFCCSDCKKYFNNPSIILIDSNITQILKSFDKTGSITKTLSEFGLTGRRGNAYLSKIIKKTGRSVLNRRNTPD